MSGRLCVAVALFALGGVPLAFADNSSLQPTAQQWTQKRSVDPYKKLFQQPAIEQTARAQQLVAAAVDAAKPRVVCGMTLIPAPNVDPKMVIEPRTDSTRYTIRAIEPPMCWQR